MAYTEFYVTKGSAVADTNGGGPSLGTNDGPVDAVADVTAVHDGAGVHTLTDNGVDGFSNTTVGDFICWDTAGAKEFARVNSLTSDDVIVVLNVGGAVAFSALSNKAVNVGGAWATVDFASKTVSISFINVAGDPPRTNVKYDAASYAEDVDPNKSGTGALPNTLEGYETSAGDGCPNGNRPIVDSSGIASNAVIVASAASYYRIGNFKFTSTQNNTDGIHTGQYSLVWNCEVDVSGTSSAGIEAGTYTHVWNCYVSQCVVNGIQLTNSGIAVGCIVDGAGGYGFVQNGASECSFLYCIANACADDGFYIDGELTALIGCVSYKSTAGSGIHMIDPTDSPRPIVANNILSENNQYGIESDADDYGGLIDFNAYYSNTQGEWKNVRNVDGAHTSLNGVTLTGDPFTAAATNDFSLDNVAGQGAACRDAGFDAGDSIGHA